MSFIAGSLIIGGAGLASSAIGAFANGGQPNIKNVYSKGPDFQQGEQATNDWLKQLTSDQNDPTGNFGAISPDWNDIWQQTQEQVHNYFNGTATNPGINDQIKASFAQRGVAGDPAASFLQSQSGANEAQQLGNLSAQQNIAKQTFANEGKTQWLNSIANFQNQVANGPTGGSWSGAVVSPTSTQQLANIFGTAGAGLAGYGLQQQSNQNQMSYLNSVLNPNPSAFSSGGFNTSLEASPLLA